MQKELLTCYPRQRILMIAVSALVQRGWLFDAVSRHRGVQVYAYSFNKQKRKVYRALEEHNKAK